MTHQKVSEEFGLCLGQVARLWRAEINRRLQDFGLTEAQWLTLVLLSRFKEPVTQKSLAQANGVREPSMVRMIDRLELEGLVARTPLGDDRRANLLRLTPAAAPKLARIHEVGEELRAEIFAEIDSADIDACFRIFEHLQNKLRENKPIAAGQQSINGVFQ